MKVEVNLNELSSLHNDVEFYKKEAVEYKAIRNKLVAQMEVLNKSLDSYREELEQTRAKLKLVSPTLKLEEPNLPVLVNIKGWVKVDDYFETTPKAEPSKLLEIKTIRVTREEQQTKKLEGLRQIKEIALKGGPKPTPASHELGSLMSQVTCSTSLMYNKAYDQMIRELRPDWFKKQGKNSKLKRNKK